MLSDLVYWDHSYNSILLLNFVIIIGLFTSLRLFSGTISHISSDDELTKKDNYAFGLSLAGFIFAITILLSGVTYGDLAYDITHSAVSVGLYGVIGIILLAITRFIFDKIAVPKISLRNEIVKGNTAVAIVDAANVIATAIIIRAVMIWIDDNTIEAVGFLLVVFLVSQIILTATIFFYIQIFKKIHKGMHIQKEILDGNSALAMTLAGKKISTALAIMIASEIVVYEVYNIWPVVLAWVVTSVVFVIILKLLSYVATRIVLFKIDLTKEIIEQKNTAIGILQAVIYVSMAILLLEL